MCYAIKIRPLSVNACWQGRRYKTSAYKAYERELIPKLPNLIIPDGNIELNVRVGFSSRASDIDNVLKPFLDILQKKYEFDDKRIYRLTVDKHITRKGAEFIAFDIHAIDHSIKEAAKCKTKR